MLTGKDVYEAFMKNKPWADAWVGLTHWRQKGYEEVAAVLNASHITPLQGLVEELQGQVEKLTNDFQSLKKMDRAIFDDQDKQILALQGLVLAYVTLVEQRIGIVNPVPSAGWSDIAVELEARAQTLLAEKE